MSEVARFGVMEEFPSDRSPVAKFDLGDVESGFELDEEEMLIGNFLVESVSVVISDQVVD